MIVASLIAVRAGMAAVLRAPDEHSPAPRRRSPVPQGDCPMKSKRISRRTVLRGAGAALALPWLETMAPAAPDARPSPNRRCAWSSCTCPTACARTTGRPRRRRGLRTHAAPQAARRPEERFPAARKSLEREDRRPQRPLAQSARLALRRLRGAHLRRRSRFRRHLRRSVRRAAHRRPHHAAELRTRPRSHPHRHRYRRRRLRAHVRLLHLLARSAHPGAQGDRSAAGVRPPVPLQQSAGQSRA